MRQGSEAVLGAIRQHALTLSTIASVMVHDPLFEWTLADVQRDDAGGAAMSVRTATTRAGAALENLNSPAVSVVGRMEEKMLGMDADVLAPHVGLAGTGAPSTDSAASVPAHVQQLLAAAADPNRLCRMFCGWKAYH